MTRSFERVQPAWTLGESEDARAVRGRHGEAVAARYLLNQGYRILARGFRTRCGEIDLVAAEGDELVFVEVKSRASLQCGDPLEAVTVAKRRRILRAAALYLQSSGSWERPCRFDLVAVRWGPAGEEEVEHIRDAFRADS
jgi:putative endonuclease